ncbi:hypothetical protein GPAL_3606 [Glaciecola pallidula DSM 14239 = ACAM 615]|uniref:Uncharacterized protein n=1 Tax=Brumicola pallidula DSM 14239 = ACAM 615 TaxID=1121922 RepID=K6ZNI4_9ALTE|nr:hypothetical protein GPAL_3606 [Glaciecola pallidula DSM 14239 = ACAM 615]
MFVCVPVLISVYQKLFIRSCLPEAVYQKLFTRSCLPEAVYQKLFGF